MHWLNYLRKERTFYSHSSVTQTVRALQGQKGSMDEVNKVISLNMKCPAVTLSSRGPQISTLKSL